MRRIFNQDIFIAITYRLPSARLLFDVPDHLCRIARRKTYLPPLSLRARVGDYRSFERVGAEFLEYFRELCELRPHDRILDIGCGCGRTALPLTNFLSESGSYVGMDIMKDAIRWCRSKITPSHPNFHFYWTDLKNTCYSPKGTCVAEDYRFPFCDQEFDLVVLVSVFTHMFPGGVQNYLGEIHRLLRRNGRCLMTFFLLNEEQERLGRENLNRINFRFGDDVCRYADTRVPEGAVGYREEHILGLCREHGLELTQPPRYGKWSGRSDGLSYQDIVVVSRA